MLRDPDVLVVLSPPYRKLRNGWFHLGLADIADVLPKEPYVLSLVPAYTGSDALALVNLVERCLNALSRELNAWLLEPTKDGEGFTDRLRRVRM
jgi:hypothetical protein